MKQLRTLLIAAMAILFVIPSYAYQYPSSSTSTTTTTSKVSSAKTDTSIVNINSANLTQLETLKGIGSKKAQAIIDYRAKNGRFKSVDDLANVKGIGKKTVDNLRNRLTAR